MKFNILNAVGRMITILMFVGAGISMLEGESLAAFLFLMVGFGACLIETSEDSE